MRLRKATQLYANIREKRRPSLGKIQVKIPLQRSPHAWKFEDRSQEEIERLERCARGDAWRLAKNILKLKEKDKATFFSPTNEWCLPAPSVIKPEEREFVVHSGASMHMLSRKDLNSAELENISASKSPTTVVTANSEVQTKEEATVYVKRLDLFVKTRQRWQTDKVQHGKLRTNRFPWFIDELFKHNYSYISNSSSAGNCSSYIKPTSPRSESTRSTALVNTTPQMTYFFGAKRVQNNYR